MKNRNPVYLFISILEGMLSGGYFYLAKKERDPLHLVTGCVWLAVSILHGLTGVREEEHLLLVEEDDYE
ncbi:hypothetical protein [Oscillibacter sp.]|uniref:hypothetical protein n=1 Tax=Oscillibacter sp. TaxID=1945593 RepID=UPI002D7FD4FC|nr:hypothetical protein [Oscillibacter sp.]